MANILDYLRWRGDLTLAQSPFNDVDGLILSSACYLPLNLQPETGAYTIAELAEKLPLKESIGSQQLFAQRRELFFAMAESRRFRDVRVHDYVDILDNERSMQFSAMTFELEDGTRFVAFRGTDSTLTGWREDFRLSYDSPVPAQLAAKAYLELAAGKCASQLRCGGHSKGGNLSVWAAAHAEPATQQRLLAVYSFDGPGMDEDEIASPGYEAISPLLHSVIPQSSIVGLLMAYHPSYRIVPSSSVSLWQHDAFTWQVLGADFEQADSLNDSASLIRATLHGWMEQADRNQRRTFSETLFRLLEASGAQTVSELKTDLFQHAAEVIDESRDIDPETREVIHRLLTLLLTQSAANAGQLIAGKSKNTIEQLTAFLSDRLRDLPGVLSSLTGADRNKDEDS